MKELNIRPFRFWCHKVIPLIYDDSLSYYELLCKVIKYLNEVIENQNQANDAIDIINDNFAVLKYYVEHYFDDLDVQDEIDNKLDEMAENGELSDLIANYLPTSNETVIYPEYIASAIYPDGRFDEDNKFRSCSVIQCITVIDSTTAYGVLCETGLHNNENILIKFNPQTCIISDQQTILSGHANDICYDGTYLYIVWDYVYTVGTDNYTTSNKITVVDLEMNLVDVKELSHRAITMTYDAAEQQFYIGSVGGIYYVYNEDLSLVLRTFEIERGNMLDYYYSGTTQTVYQTAQFKDGFLYVLFSFPCMFVRYDTNGNLKQIYNFPLMLSNGGSLGEIECICWDNSNDCWLGVALGVLGLRDYDCNSFFKFNLTKGQVSFSVASASTRPNLPSSTIYVDPTGSTNARMLGTSAYPFRYLQQALDYAHLEVRPIRILTLNLPTASANSLGCANLGNLNNIFITSYSEYDNTELDKYLVPKMLIEECSNVQIFNNNIKDLEIKMCSGIQLDHNLIDTATYNRVLGFRNGSNNVYETSIAYSICSVDDLKRDQAPTVTVSATCSVPLDTE